MQKVKTRVRPTFCTIEVSTGKKTV